MLHIIIISQRNHKCSFPKKKIVAYRTLSEPSSQPTHKKELKTSNFTLKRKSALYRVMSVLRNNTLYCNKSAQWTEDWFPFKSPTAVDVLKWILGTYVMAINSFRKGSRLLAHNLQMQWGEKCQEKSWCTNSSDGANERENMTNFTVQCASKLWMFGLRNSALMETANHDHIIHRKDHKFALPEIWDKY